MTKAALPARWSPGDVIRQFLRGLRERSSAAVGGAYAELASTVLERSEHLEDLRAERRYQRRAARVQRASS